MQKKKLSIFLVIVFALAMFAPIAHATDAQAAEEQKTITDVEIGTHDGYDYELWKDSGTTSMTLKGGGTFSCSWSDINNALFRIGKKFDETQTYEQIGNISITYDCDYQPVGNSYLCVYGWTSDPLVEYYVVDSWGNWRPPGATSKGTVTVDGGTYDIYETTRTEQPSIKGTATFQQYWSVRTEKRTSGTISVSEHFKAWESVGMKLGNMYEAAILIEGYQSSGTADMLSNAITIGGEISDQAAVVNLPRGMEPREGTAVFGTPVMDGKKDDIWDNAKTLPIDRMLQTKKTASGTARAMWDDNNLYVLAEVTDNDLDNTSATVHEKDSVEVFVDEKNCKAGSYAQDDGQYRVCYDGSQSFGDSTNSDGFESAVTVDGSNFIVEMKIPFKTLKPEAAMEIGFDAQINDARDGARTGIAKWNDSSDNSWQSTSDWGVLTLAAPDGDANVAATPAPSESIAVTEQTNDAATSPDNQNTNSNMPQGIFVIIFAILVVSGIIVAVIIRRRQKP